MPTPDNHKTPNKKFNSQKPIIILQTFKKELYHKPDGNTKDKRPLPIKKILGPIKILTFRTAYKAGLTLILSC